jgi:Tol biopolymer transport system component
MKKIILIVLYGLLFSSLAGAYGDHVYQKHGNVYYYFLSDEYATQLTHSFQDSDPVLSPNSRWVAFLRKSRFPIPKSCHAYYDPNDRYGKEIWIYDLKKRKERLLVANDFACGDHLTQTIIDPADLKFSPDSKTLYFETSAWDTSGAIHSVKIDGSQLIFVTNGNGYRVVIDGKYKGDLIINQHRYHRHGSSYDWDWLYSPNGKQIKLYEKIS